MIRRAQLNDVAAISLLFDNYRIFYRKASDISGAKLFLKERLEKNEAVIFVHELNGELTGFAQLYPQFSSTRMLRSWLLNDLFVKEEYRGRGISKELIEAAKKLAAENNAAEILLETEKTNDPGNRLYPSVGFKLNQESNYYWWENSMNP